MESIYRALIESIVYIATREVPDDIADDDVRALEAINAELGTVSREELEKLIALAQTMKDSASDPVRKQGLGELIENLTAWN
ncbi:MAG: hypothetical protein Q7Q71_00015 [Verrucomicrobiota bacterium JB023]|nr:hypothetical protein [Verrucomicrobiota bacterium JB023]